MPRDIDPEVATLSGVYLYTIDDLTSVIEENIEGRKESAKHAEEIITEAVKRYERELGVRNGQELIEFFVNRRTTFETQSLNEPSIDSILVQILANCCRGLHTI